MEIHTSDGVEVRVKKEQPEQIIVYGASGFGKTLFMESIAEAYHTIGYIVIYLNDIKDEMELCYSMFEPKEAYHLEFLRKYGRKPSKKKIKIFSPFSFNIPKSNLPPIRFFTVPIKSLGREEISMITETHSDSNVIKLLLNNIENMKNTDTIYDLMYRIEQSIERQKQKIGDQTIIKRDWNKFGLKGAMSGSIKDIEEIQSMFLPFLKQFFLTDKNHPLNLDVEKELFSNQEEYKILVTPFVKDTKMKYFVKLVFYFQIIRLIQKCRKPVLFVIDEIGTLTPFRPEGFRFYMGEAIRDNVSTVRGKGRGCATLMGAQVFSNVDEKVRESSTKTWFGRMGGIKDIETIGKALKYNVETVRLLKDLDRNKYILKGYEDLEGFTGMFPSHMHAETKYNFIEMYLREFPDKAKNYSELVKEINELKRNQFKEYKDRIIAIEREKQKRVDQSNKEKEDKEMQQESQKQDQVKDIKIKLVDERKTRAWEEYQRMLNEKGKANWRELGRLLKVSHHTAKKWILSLQPKDTSESQDSEHNDD